MVFWHLNFFLGQKWYFDKKKTQKFFFDAKIVFRHKNDFSVTDVTYELCNIKTGSKRRRSKVFVLSNDKAVSRCEILNRKNKFWRNEVAKNIAEFIKKCLDNKHYIVISVKNRLEQGARFM